MNDVGAGLLANAACQSPNSVADPTSFASKPAPTFRQHANQGLVVPGRYILNSASGPNWK